MVIFEEPAVCVDYYYNSILDVNHLQYQHCVLSPLSLEDFKKKAGARKKKMEEQGLKRCEQIVRGRTDFIKKGDKKTAVVYAISP